MNKKVEERKQELVNEFIHCLDEDLLPWEKGWNMVFHKNIITGKKYKGINQLILMYVANKFHYSSEIWGTFQQMKSQKLKIKAGSKSKKIIYYSWHDKTRKENISYYEMKNRIENGRDEEEFYPVSRLYDVFNVEDTENYCSKKEKENDIDFISDYLKKENITLIFGGNDAYYYPPLREIRIPNKEQFKSDNSYYSTILHEIAHSTMPKVDRIMPTELENEEKYAFEELVAEISSVFLCCQMKIEMEPLQNHKAYIKGWANRIRSNSDYLFKAIKSAEKVTEYVLSV